MIGVEGRQTERDGFSTNEIAREPFAAVRCTSLTASSTDHSGRIVSGIRRSGAVGHHSSRM